MSHEHHEIVTNADSSFVIKEDYIKFRKIIEQSFNKI
jgi:hypothetical protein